MGWVFHAADNAPTDGPQITAIAIIMTALALTTVLLRLYVRFGIIQASGIGKIPHNNRTSLQIVNLWISDDWLIIFAWVWLLLWIPMLCSSRLTRHTYRSHRLGLRLSPLYVRFNTSSRRSSTDLTVDAETRYGLGLQRIADLPADDVYAFGLVSQTRLQEDSNDEHDEADRRYLQLQYMGAPFYITSILGFKISLLCSYLRFIPGGAYRWATYVVLVLTILFHFSFLMVQVNLCSPVSLRKRIKPLILLARPQG